MDITLITSLVIIGRERVGLGSSTEAKGDIAAGQRGRDNSLDEHKTLTIVRKKVFAFFVRRSLRHRRSDVGPAARSPWSRKAAATTAAADCLSTSLLARPVEVSSRRYSFVRIPEMG